MLVVSAGNVAKATPWRSLRIQILIILILTGGALQCGPGRKSGRVRRPRKMTPLVFKQHVPNVSENTLGASGPVEKPISRENPEFKNLVENYNSDIIFKDEEGTGADRIMSQRCKDKLNTLAIAVMNRWPEVKLRVTEAWDEDRHHDRDPLHYEGRAVDITTSDRDRSKYGMLARLAVEAGFDWVYYESRTHIHVSVKSDSSITIKTGGCFSSDSLVRKSTGEVTSVSDLSVGDHVLAMDSQGAMKYSQVYMFLDIDPTSRSTFVTLATESGHNVTVTPSHILYVSDVPTSPASEAKSTFASRIKTGQYLYTAENNATFAQSRVVSVEVRSQVGFYAPLTKDGTIVVNDVLASCYAFFDSPTIAHASFAPVRWYFNTWNYFRRKLGVSEEASLEIIGRHTNGIHWYAQGLHALGKAILSSSFWYTV